MKYNWEIEDIDFIPGNNKSKNNPFINYSDTLIAISSFFAVAE